MIASNMNITTYRLVRSGNTDSWSGTPTLNGFPVFFSRPDDSEVNVVDQENGYEVYKMESMEDMNVIAGDKVVTNEPTSRTMTVHRVEKQPFMFGNGIHTCITVRIRR